MHVTFKRIYARMDLFIEEKLESQREEANEQDPYGVVIVKGTAGHRTKVVGHVPRRISAACLY